MSTEKPSVEGLMALVAQACSIAFDCGEAEDGGSMTKLSAAQEAIRTYATSLCAPSVEPEGWKLVPLEPTHEMLEAGAMRIAMNEQYVATAEAKAEAVWRDMLAASPSSSVLERARDALKEILALDVARSELAYLDRGIGTATVNAAWLRARSALAEIDRALGGGNAE